MILKNSPSSRPSFACRHKRRIKPTTRSEANQGGALTKLAPASFIKRRKHDTNPGLASLLNSNLHQQTAGRCRYQMKSCPRANLKERFPFPHAQSHTTHPSFYREQGCLVAVEIREQHVNQHVGRNPENRSANAEAG